MASSKRVINGFCVCLVFLFCFSLTVSAASGDPNICIDPNSFSFSALEGGSDPDTQLMTITNGAEGTLNWSIDTTSQPDWLNITPTSGSLDPNESEDVTLSVDANDLSAGDYHYSFNVIDPSADNNPQTVNISLQIRGTLYVPTDYPTIQSALDAADEGDTIVVLPGAYVANISFNGKDVILTSTDPEDPAIVASTIIDGGDNGSVVTFSGSETAACELRGFTITNGNDDSDYDSGGGIAGYRTQATIAYCSIIDNRAYLLGAGLARFDGLIEHTVIANNLVRGDYTEFGYDYGLAGGLFDCDGPISHCVITGNEAGVGGLCYCDGAISNCIIWGNTGQLYSCSIPTYSCIQDWTGGGAGNITSDPLFADPDNGDYHLKSEYGRWNAETKQWGYDTVTSPCIDAGMPDPNDWYAELWPHGGRINMGAYGGTPIASMSPSPVGNMADLDHDDVVSILDADLFSEDWLLVEYLLDTDLNRDGRVDIADFALFADQWLWEEYPILKISSNAFDIVALENGPNQECELTISNIGGRTLNWALDLTGKPDWLNIAPTSGSLDWHESAIVTLTVNISGLNMDIGTYAYTFMVSDPQADNSPQSVAIQLSVCDDYIVVPDDSSTIQTAIDFVVENGTVVVSPGIYYENLVLPGIDFVLTSTDPEDSSVVDSTIIDGNQNGSVVTFSGTETSACQLRGLTITNGELVGMDGNQTHATISGCIMTGNVRSGLIRCDGLITHCIITENGRSGLDVCNGRVFNCTISDNDSSGLKYCNARIFNCTISGNDSSGLYICDGIISNCTISGNRADNHGGGFFRCDGIITNCIIWGNSGAGQLYYSSRPTYSCIQSWTGGGTGNISSDPLFADTSSGDPADWDLHLLGGSPCIDAGTNSPTGGLPATDKDGNPRIIDGDANGSAIVDMGAYEFQNE